MDYMISKGLPALKILWVYYNCFGSMTSIFASFKKTEKKKRIKQVHLSILDKQQNNWIILLIPILPNILYQCRIFNIGLESQNHWIFELEENSIFVIAWWVFEFQTYLLWSSALLGSLATQTWLGRTGIDARSV